jgi:hypothetical protein
MKNTWKIGKLELSENFCPLSVHINNEDSYHINLRFHSSLLQRKNIF